MSFCGLARATTVFGLAFLISSTTTIAAQKLAEEKATEYQDTTVARGNIKFRVPKAWQVVQPRVRMIEREFSVPPAKGDEVPCRLTVMNAQGSVEANIARWQGQFQQPDGTSTSERTKIEKQKIADRIVHCVDIAGTYQDRRGPFAPAVSRDRYRMLAAIVPTKTFGQYFFKLYGPQETMAKTEKHFQEMLKSLQVDE